MASFLYKRPIYFADGETGAPQELGRSVNQLQSDFAEVKRQVQRNSDAIVFLQGRLRDALVPAEPTGVPAIPIVTTTVVDAETTHFEWVAVPGLTEIIVTLDGVRMRPGPAPTDWQFDHSMPVSRDPLGTIVEYIWSHANRFGTGPTYGVRFNRLAPPPRNLRATNIAPTVYRLDWDPGYDGPPAKGYAVFSKGNKVKEDVASAVTRTTTITVPLGTRTQFEVASFSTLPSNDDTTSFHSAPVEP
jgi:hypothetical protein